MLEQVAIWQGEFGNAYTERNLVQPAGRVEAFREMLRGLELRRVLEVGCNRAHNLVALRDVFSDATELVGIEPNPQALSIARCTGFPVLRGDARDLMFRSESFDLVFTAGVLIHIPLQSIPAAMREIARVSARYILAIEYFAETETVIPYRGHEQLLWKRDFLAHYQANVPGLTLLRSGYWTKDQGFDRAHWWLLAKNGLPA